MKALDGIRCLNRGLSALLQIFMVTVFVLLVVDVIWGVGSRYLFGDQAAWSEELARLLMVWLALLAAALVVRENGHLGLDVLVRRWPAPLRRLAGIFVSLAVLAFALGIMAWGGWDLVQQRFASGQTLPALGVAKAWFYLALPVSGLLMSLFSLEHILSNLVGEITEPDAMKEAGL